MKITAQEEYGLRILIRIARCMDEEGLSITQLSEAEGLTPTYVGKLTRLLRLNGFLRSRPGNKGGYVLARPANEININEVLKSLGGALFDQAYCGEYKGAVKFCTNSVDCSARSLWQVIQFTIDQLLDQVTLAQLSGREQESESILERIANESVQRVLQQQLL